MKTLLSSFLVIGALASSWASTTINTANKYAWGANFGWLDCRGDTSSGAVIGEYVCSGYVYAANVGWINLGSGSPTNGIYYQNLSANDFGVNQDGLGNLRGYAWGANIGWINFEDTGAPRVDLATGNLTGYAYSANCSWISLSNAFAHVQTDSIPPGADTDADGIADAWELTHTNSLSGFSSSGDADADSMSDLQEYLAGTDPNDGNDYLRITGYATAPGGTTNAVTWSSTPARVYYLQKTLSLGASPWLDSGLGLISPDGATTTRGVADTNAPMRFYRVEAIRPLSP